MTEYKLRTPVTVSSATDLALAEKRVSDKKSIRELSFLTHEMSPSKLMKLSDILCDDSKIFSIEMRPLYAGFNGKATKYYSVKVCSTQEELEKIQPKVDAILEKTAELDKNSDIESGRKHSQYIQSIAEENYEL
jgi:hypothetical protein